MGHPRNTPLHSTTTTATSQMNFQSSSQPSAPINTQIPVGTSLGMSPASRYKHNIKVLRRRDPSITSIFDQFSHVCVYHHDGEAWRKQGYEGTMFLFERASYPPYGLYVLNRVGAEDYIQGIYPEDEFVTSGQYLIVKSFPDFLARRLANLPSTANGEPHDRFSDVYTIPNIDQIDSKMKGRSTVVGLWTLASSSRESMDEVLKKLHSYIKKNEPYPARFRYDPDKPPPPHRLQAVPRQTAGYTSDISDSQRRSQSDSETDHGNHSDAPSANSGGMSEVEMLFYKKLVVPSIPSHQPQSTQSTSIDLNTLFASVAPNSSSSSQASDFSAAPPSNTSSSGISLLNSIFASASSPQPPKQTAIISPQPTISTSGPQVLNQDVLSNLLGLPSRTASAASTFSTSASLISHPSSREGDNEDDGESDSPGGLTDPTDNTHRRPGQNIARTASSELLTSLGLGVSRLGPQGKINGDVTPRGPLNQSLQGRPPVPSSIESIPSTATVRAGPQQYSNMQSLDPKENNKPRANRTLVPFEPDSELWPYSRGLVDESSPTDGGDDGEIVELDFGETSVLSDPAAFDKVLKNRKSAISLKGNVNGHAYANGSGNGAVRVNATANGNGKKNKKSKKEQQKEEIERSWDIPPPSPAAHNVISNDDLLYGPPASPSPCPSPVLNGQQHHGLQVAPIAEMKTPTMNANAVLGQINGYSHVSNASLPPKGKGKAVMNGRAKTNGYVNNLDAETVTDSMITALGRQPNSMSRLERNEFAKQLLTLIQTDKAFVDTLWHEYLARST